MTSEKKPFRVTFFMRHGVRLYTEGDDPSAFNAVVRGINRSKPPLLWRLFHHHGTTITIQSDDKPIVVAADQIIAVSFEYLSAKSPNVSN